MRLAVRYTVIVCSVLAAGCASAPPFRPMELEDRTSAVDECAIEVTWESQERLPPPPKSQGSVFRSPRTVAPIGPNHQLVTTISNWSGRPRWSIESLDEEGEVLASESLGERKDQYEGLFAEGDRFYVLLSRLESGSRTKFLLVQEVLKDGLVLQEPREVASVPYEVRLFRQPSTFYLRVAEDRVHVVSVAPDRDGETSTLFGFVFDRNLALLSEESHPLDSPAHLVDVEDISVDPDGAFRIVAVVYDGSRRRFIGGKPNYEYRFLTLSNGMSELQQVRVVLENHTVQSLRFAYRPGGEVACVGLYSDETTAWSTGASGSFYMRLDGASSEVSFSNYHPFDEELRRQLLKERQVDREVDVSNANIRDLRLLPDESVLLICEISDEYITEVTFETKDTSYSGGYTTTTRTTVKMPTYVRDSIIAMRLAPDGTPIWGTTIPKTQFSQSDGGIYLSFAYAFVADRILVVYNDDPENIGRALGEVSNPFKRRNAWGVFSNVDLAIVAAVVNGDGTVTQEVLYSPPPGSGPVLILPEESYQSSGDGLSFVADTPGSRARGRIRLAAP